MGDQSSISKTTLIETGCYLAEGSYGDDEPKVAGLRRLREEGGAFWHDGTLLQIKDLLPSDALRGVQRKKLYPKGHTSYWRGATGRFEITVTFKARGVKPEGEK